MAHIVGSPHLEKRQEKDLDLGLGDLKVSTTTDDDDGKDDETACAKSDAADESEAGGVEFAPVRWPSDMSHLVERVIKSRRPQESRKVVSFCVFGDDDDSRYARGAVANARLARALYPDWRAIFYVGGETATATLEELSSWGAEVRVCSTRATGRQLQLLRYAPCGEIGVEACVVRDADARLNAREAAAVGQWLASGKPFHVMHEAPHDERFVYGGLWGVRSEPETYDAPLPELHFALAEFVATQSSRLKQDDMAFLELYLTPGLCAENTMHHAADVRARFIEDLAPNAFPDSDYSGYVGQPFSCRCAWDLFKTMGCEHATRCHGAT